MLEKTTVIIHKKLLFYFHKVFNLSQIHFKETNFLN